MQTSNANRPKRIPTLEEQTRHFRGRGQQQPRARDRRALQEFLSDPRGQLAEPLVALGGLVRDANALRPEAIARLSEQMDALQGRWQSRPDGQADSAADTIESILLPYLEAGVPLRQRGVGPSWAFGLLVEQLRAFDTSEMVLERLATQWSKSTRAEGSVATLTRLAVAAGWLAWSHLIVEPALARAFLNVQLELVDRLDRQAHRADAVITDEDRSWAATALTLETRLHRHLAAPPVFVH